MSGGRFVGLTLGLMACGAQDAPTFQADIRPIVERSCLECHQPGGVAPLDFTYDPTWKGGVPPWAAAAAAAVADRRMPPWLAADDCHPIQDARNLSADEIATFTAWADAEFPAGKEAEFVPLDPYASVMAARRATLGEPDIEAAASEAYTPDAAQPDDYRCIVVDHDFTEDLWVNGLEIALDQKAYVHHLILYAFDPSSAEQVDADDAADPGPGFTCFGNPNAETLLAWAPGGEGEFLPDGLGRHISAGTRLVMQIHYNTLGRDPTTIPADQTGVRIWIADEKPAQGIFTLPFADMNLDIPAGKARVVEKDTFSVRSFLGGDLPIDLPIVGTMGHMHNLGSAIRLDVADTATKQKQCLLDIPRWDFNWQRGYYYAEEDWVYVGSDHELRMTCTFDNSASNQQVVNGEQLEPRDVAWGDSTLDEMCLTYVLTGVPAAFFEQ